MNIVYKANIGESRAVDVFAPTAENFYYRSLTFKLESLENGQIELFLQFLKSNIELLKVELSSEAVVVVAHGVAMSPNRKVVDHIVTLIGARILICNSLRWGFAPTSNLEGYKFTIYLPTAVRPKTPEEIFDALKQNDKPLIERKEIEPPHFLGKLLVWLGLRKRKYSITINGADYTL